MSTLKISELPAPAWNRMKVNNAVVSCPQQLCQEQTAFTVSGISGPGIRLAEKTLLSGVSMPSALGDGAAAYVENHANNRVCLEISGAYTQEEPVFLSYTLRDSDLADVLEIYAGEGSRATIVLSYRSEGEKGGFHGNLVRLYAKSHSSVRLIQIQMLKDQWNSMDNVSAVCEEQANITVTQIELGAGEVYSGCRAELKEYQSQADIRCCYMGRKTQTLDFNYVVRHLAKNTKSAIDARGILMDKSQKLLRGTIDFPTGCAQSAGSEQETVLLLSPQVKNVTVPLILCTEEDVEGSHGATIGNLSEEQLFYLKCRGLMVEDIWSLLTESFTESVCREALEEGLAGEIRQFAANRQKGGGDKRVSCS